MGNTLKEWDRDVAPHLDSLERHARWIEYHAVQIVAVLSLLKKRPEFPTKAQAALHKAELLISEAITEYESKPPEKANEG